MTLIVVPFQSRTDTPWGYVLRVARVPSAGKGRALSGGPQRCSRAPRAAVCVLSPKLFGEWIQTTGPVAIVFLLEAMEQEQRRVVVLASEELGPRISG